MNERSAIVKQTLDGLESVAFDLTPMEAAADEWILGLEEATRRALEKNPAVKISYLSVDSQRQVLRDEKSAFLPVFDASASIDRFRTEGAAPGEGASFTAGVSQLLPTNGTAEIALSHDRTNREAREYDSSVGVSLSQPLLRDFGPGIAYASIRLARIDFSVSITGLKQSLIDTISDAQIAYWDILRFQEELKARRLSYRQASDLVDQNEREEQLGNRAYTDVLQAEATAASREEDVLSAENALKDAEDALKQIIYVDSFPDWDRRVRIADRIDGEFRPIELDSKWCVDTAFAHRPDYRSALEQYKRSRIEVMLAKNDLLPDVTLDYSYEQLASGLSGESFPRSLRSGDHFPQWAVGLSLRLPWGYESERALYNINLNEHKRQKLAINALRLQVFRETRAAVRDVETNIKRVRAAQLAYELQAKKLEAEQKKFSLGLSTSFEVLQYQEDLLNASVTRIGAIVGYHQSVIRLWRTIGITLEKNGIEFEEA